MNVGDIVRVKKRVCDEPINTLGYVFHTDPTKCYVISEQGVYLGWFDELKQTELLSYVCRSNFNYKYTDLITLRRDWDKGIFLPAFNCVRK